LEELKSSRATAVHAKKEVIISAGAVSTPQILMLSGIGPSQEMKRHGIGYCCKLARGRRKL